MANPTQRARQFELALVGGPTNLALDVPAEEAPGAEKIPDCALPVAVDDGSADLGSLDIDDEYGDWKDEYADAVGISSWSEL